MFPSQTCSRRPPNRVATIPGRLSSTLRAVCHTERPSIEMEVRSLTAQILQHQQALHQAQHDGLQLQQIIRQKEAQEAALTSEMSRLQEHSDTVQLKIENSNVHIQSLRAENMTLKKENASLTHRYARAQCQLSQLRLDASKLTSQNNNMNKDLSSARLENDSLIVGNNKKDSTIKTLTACNKTLENKIDSMTKAHMDDAISFQRTISTSTDQIRQLKFEMEHLKSRNTKLEALLTDSVRKEEEISKQNAHLDEALSNALTKITDLSTSNERISA